MYVPDPADRLDPDVSPLRATSHAGLPPALVIVAEYDPLRDEGRGYAEKLAAAGVEVEVAEFDDMMHGFFVMPGFFDRGGEALARAADYLRGLC
jgi:acetyl esterase